MSQVSRVVSEIMPPLYEDVAADLGIPRTINLAGSNQCHILSKGLYLALNARQLEARREYHKSPDDEPWHFVIAHAPVDAEPHKDDLITDLNPWQFMNSVPGHLTYLHAPRGEVMERLRKEGAPDYFVALRGLDTIVRSHTEVTNPAALNK